MSVIDSTSNSKKVRNCFAHHVWGVSEDLPNKLVSIDPDMFMQFWLVMNNGGMREPGKGGTARPARPILIDGRSFYGVSATLRKRIATLCGLAAESLSSRPWYA